MFIDQISEQNLDACNVLQENCVGKLQEQLEINSSSLDLALMSTKFDV